jgi:hypothetical protein
MATLFLIVTLILLGVGVFRFVTTQRSDRPRLRAAGAMSAAGLSAAATVVGIIGVLITSLTLFWPIVAGIGTGVFAVRTQRLLNRGQ